MQKSWLTLTSLLLTLMVATSARRDLHERSLLTVYVDDAKNAAHLLENIGFDVVGADAKEGWTQIVVQDSEEVKKLEKTLVSFGMEQQRAPLLERTTSYESRQQALDGEIKQYGDVQHTLETMNQLAASFPQYAHVFDLTAWLGGSPTAEGRHIYALQISSNPKTIEDKPKMLIIGEHHARELMTHTAVMDSARAYLAQASAGIEPFATGLSTAAVWFVPMVNPDGLDHVFRNDRMWRKNRRPNEDGSYGVDLNRNYGFKWGECGSNSSYGSSDTYKGEAPFSEPESRLMDMLNDRLRAQYLVSYHSSGNEVLYPYVCGELAEREGYYDLRDRLASHLSFGKRNASSSGEDFEHHYAQYGTLSFLLEIGRSFQPSYEEYESRVWTRVEKVLPFFLKEIQTRSFLNVRIVDEDNQPVVGASLQLDQVTFREGEQRTTDEFGRYRWQLSPGDYDLRVTSSAGQAHVKVRASQNGLSSETVIQLTPLSD